MSQKPSFSSRQDSLKYYKEQGIADLPSFLHKNDSPESVIISEPAKSTKNLDVINMKVSTLLGFLALITVLGALLFGAGYMVAYSMHSAPVVKPSVVVKKPAVITPAAKPVVVTPPAAKAPATSDGLVVQDIAQPVATLPAVLSKFTLEFAEADDLKAANDVSGQLTQNGMNVKIAEVKDQNGRSSFKVYSTAMFINYEDAYSHLQKLKKPYSNWGKVVNLDEAVSDSE